jgi:hypothetical protein
MPRVNRKTKAVASLTDVVNNRLQLRCIRMLHSDDEDSFEDLQDLASVVFLSELRKRRYYKRRKKYRKCRAEERLNKDLYNNDADATNRSHGSDSSSSLPWLSDVEFLQKFRVTKNGFSRILEFIKDHSVFQSKTKRMAPPEYQLMVFLKYVGTEGDGANNAGQRNTFGIGYGTALNYRRRVTDALRSLSDQFIRWPDAEERHSISQQIRSKYDFPHCVGIADGTLFPLAFAPESDDAPDYSGRKYGHSITCMIVCDHTRRIRHYLAGFPGSAHDNRVFKATKLYQEPEQYFDTMQYILGDSAFENSWFMVSAFKKPKDQPIPQQHEQFNGKLASLRIISEHCIGILKGRFPWLRTIRMKITNKKKSVKMILHLIEATIVLHNMLLDFGDEEREDWIDSDDASALDDESRVPVLSPTDVLNQGVPQNSPKDERRQRIRHYFEEHVYF